MLRIAWFSLIALLLALPASAQEWADKMFNTTTHDFGTVAKGSKAEFRFQIKNLYEEDAHIQAVRSSCGCTTPQITRSDLKTFETGEIVAEFNTRDFTGHKSATLFVTFDKPFHAEVQLHITGFIRSDVVTQPGAVDFGTVDQGAAAEQRLQVTYAGRDDWRILDAKTADPWYEVEMKETARGNGRVAYDLVVRMTKDAPLGYVKDQLILVTNDSHAREFPVDLEGRVTAEITISPTKLFLGVMRPGQKVTKNLVVRGKKPFRIVKVDCPECFQIEPSKEPRTVHLIPVVFTAGKKTGRVAQKISLHTDQADIVQAFTAFAEVVEADVAAGQFVVRVAPTRAAVGEGVEALIKLDPGADVHEISSEECCRWSPRWTIRCRHSSSGRPPRVLPWCRPDRSRRLRRPRLCAASPFARRRVPNSRQQPRRRRARSGFANPNSSINPRARMIRPAWPRTNAIAERGTNARLADASGWDRGSNEHVQYGGNRMPIW